MAFIRLTSVKSGECAVSRIQRGDRCTRVRESVSFPHSPFIAQPTRARAGRHIMTSVFVDNAFTTTVFLVCLACLLSVGMLWAVKNTKLGATSGRRPRFENLEARLPLD